MSIRADLPPIQADLGERLECQFDGAEQQLHQPRKHRKARQKVEPGRFQEVRDGRRQALPAARDAVNAQRSSRDLYTQSLGQRQMAQRLGCMSESQMRQQLIPGGASSYSMPTLPSVPLMSHSEDPKALMQMFKGGQSYQSQLGTQMHRISRDSQQQLNLNTKIQGIYKNYEHMEQAASLRQQSLENREGMLSNLGHDFEAMAGGFSNASGSLESASDSLYTAANAMAGIPGQGAAMAAAFRATASSLRASSRSMYTSYQGMKKMSRKMFIMSKKTYWSSLKAGIERKSLSVEKMRTKISLNQGARRLKQIQSAQSQVGDAFGKSLQNQQGLSIQLKGQNLVLSPTQQEGTNKAVSQKENFDFQNVNQLQQQQAADHRFAKPVQMPTVREVASGAARPNQFAVPQFKVPKLGGLEDA